jgi:hypothetical protein
VWRLPPYSLEVRAPIGGHPLDGGVLVFDLPGSVSMLETMGTTGINTSWYYTRQTLEAAQLQVTIKPVAGRTDATEVTVFCDLRPGVRRNVLAASWLSGALGSLGSVFAAGIAAKQALILTMFTATVPAAVAGLVIAGGTIAGYRASYRYSVNRARGELTRALDAIEGGIQSEALFGSLSPSRLESQSADPPRRR